MSGDAGKVAFQGNGELSMDILTPNAALYRKPEPLETEEKRV